MTRDFYELLGLDEDASKEEIRDAFRDMVQEYHPDRNDDPRATAQFTIIKKAYDTLKDPAERQSYDRLGHKDYVAKRLDGIPDPSSWPSEDDEDSSASDTDTSSTRTSSGATRGSSGTKHTTGSTAGSASGSGTAASSTGYSSGGSTTTSRATGPSSTTGSSSGNATGSAGGSGTSTTSGSSSSGGSSTASGTETGSSRSSTMHGDNSSSSRSRPSAQETAGATGGTANASTGGANASATGSATASATGGASASTAETSTGTTDGTGSGDSDEAISTGRLSVFGNAVAQWIGSKPLGWRAIILSFGLYLAGLAHYGYENAAGIETLVADLQAAGTDTDTLQAVLLGSATDYFDPAWQYVSVTAPAEIGPSIVFALGAVVMPLMFFLAIRRTREHRGRDLSYLFALAVFVPLAVLAATGANAYFGAVETVPLAVVLLGYGVVPLLAGLVLIGRRFVWTPLRKVL